VPGGNYIQYKAGTKLPHLMNKNKPKAKANSSLGAVKNMSQIQMTGGARGPRQSNLNKNSQDESGIVFITSNEDVSNFAKPPSSLAQNIEAQPIQEENYQTD